MSFILQKSTIVLSILLILSSISVIKSQTISPPVFSKKSGFYEKEFLLTLTTEEKKAKILYTVDGSNPLTSDTRVEYEDPILIVDRTNESNIYSEYEDNFTSPQSIGYRTGYHKPNYPVDKCMVVRAVTVNSEKESSNVISQTYFILTDELKVYQDYTVVSIVTDPANLFDPEIGIYVTGNQFINWVNSDEYDPNKNQFALDNKCNYFGKGKEWERESYITIFEKGEINIERNFGLRLKGASTRNLPGKSFELIPRNNEGKKELVVNDNLLPDNVDIDGKKINEYECIHLRAITDECRLRDKFFQEILNNNKRDLALQNMKNAVVFLNGEYWGFYQLMEKYSDKYIENHYHLPKENVALIKENSLKEGKDEELDNFKNLITKYSKEDLSQDEKYKELCNYIDIDSFIEIYVIGAYIGIVDWPNQNQGEWRYTENPIEANDYSDGKWRFFVFDFDWSIGKDWDYHLANLYAEDHFTYINRRKDGIPTTLFLNLLNNKEFKNRFVNTYCDYANEVMRVDKMIPQIEKYRKNVTELLVNGQIRWWGGGPKLDSYISSKNLYIKDLSDITTFFRERPNFTLEHMQDYFGLKGKFHRLTVIVNGDGKFKINTIIPELVNNKWSGKYFSSVPVTISAIPSKHSVFKSWSIDKDLGKDTIILNVNEPTEITINFEEK